MRPLALAFTVALTASAASAGGINFSLPSVHFPPQPDIVTQDCQTATTLTLGGCDMSQ